MSDGSEEKLILDEGSLQLQTLKTEPTKEWVEQLTLMTNRHLIDETGQLNKSTGILSRLVKDFQDMKCEMIVGIALIGVATIIATIVGK